MIRLTDIDYRINGKPILNHISLELASGQIIALIGPNGAGKSTLFSLMARINPLQKGIITFDNHDVSQTDNKTLSQVLAILTQDNAVQGRLRVYELLMFGRYPYHGGKPTQVDKDKVAQVIQRFELQALSGEFLSDLSGGQRQRVMIAMIVCQDTPYLLLDEPLNNLDIYHTGQLMRQLRHLTYHEGKTVVIVLHDINQASQFADTIVMLKSGGQIMAVGKPAEVITKQTMKDLYNADVTLLMHKDKPVIIDAL